MSGVLLSGGRIDLDAFEGIAVAQESAFHEAFFEAGVPVDRLLLVSSLHLFVSDQATCAPLPRSFENAGGIPILGL